MEFVENFLVGKVGSRAPIVQRPDSYGKEFHSRINDRGEFAVAMTM